MEVKTGHGFVLIGEQQANFLPLDFSDLYLNLTQDITNLFRDPHRHRELHTVFRELHLTGVLQTLQQARCPIVVAQGCVNTTGLLGITGTIDIAQHILFALLEDLLQLRTLDITDDRSRGTLADNDTTRILQRSL